MFMCLTLSVSVNNKKVEFRYKEAFRHITMGGGKYAMQGVWKRIFGQREASILP
jgi:hypothetical protein